MQSTAVASSPLFFMPPLDQDPSVESEGVGQRAAAPLLCSCHWEQSKEAAQKIFPTHSSDRGETNMPLTTQTADPSSGRRKGALPSCCSPLLLWSEGVLNSRAILSNWVVLDLIACFFITPCLSQGRSSRLTPGRSLSWQGHISPGRNSMNAFPKQEGNKITYKQHLLNLEITAALCSWNSQSCFTQLFFRVNLAFQTILYHSIEPTNTTSRKFYMKLGGGGGAAFLAILED